MDKQKLKNEVDEAFNLFTKEILNEFGELPFMFCVIFTLQKDGKKIDGKFLNVIEDDFSFDNRHSIIHNIGGLLAMAKHLGKIEQVGCFMTIAEAWASVYQNNSVDKMPSEKEDREEIVIVHAENEQRELELKAKSIIRIGKHFSLSDTDLMSDVAPTEAGTTTTLGDSFWEGYKKGLKKFHEFNVVPPPLIVGSSIEEFLSQGAKVIINQLKLKKQKTNER